MKFMLGANYWGERWGTEMWLHYDPKEIRDEMKQLREYGIKWLRVFPNWRDFQPVERAYGYKGEHGEFINSRTGMPIYDDGVDPEMIENFRDFCRAADEYGISLVVSIVTGWMSGRLFTPPVLNGKNLISDAEALMWMRRFIHRFVRELKNEGAIKLWDLGNECNCLGEAEDRYEAYVWTSTVADAIRSEDNTRKISSGMHGLTSRGSSKPSKWFIEDQGEMCDILTTHPYPSPTVNGDLEPYTRLRTTFLPTAQTLYYAGISEKEAYIQESGTFTQTIGSREMSADFMRIQILSSIANGLIGYQWWCAWEQSHLDFPPYSWSIMERQLGMFDKDRNPKPVAYVMKDMSALLDKIPDPFPKPQADGVCLLSRSIDHQKISISSLIFGKQAGIDLAVSFHADGNIPDSSLYFVPDISFWNVLYKSTWDALLKRAEDGAVVCFSYGNGHLADFPEVVGAISNGVMANVSHSFTVDGERVDYHGKEILLEAKTAEVLIRNEEGNPVLLKNAYGKGSIYFINFSPEENAFAATDGFNKSPYYKLYEIVAKAIIDEKLVRVNDRNIGITVNPEDERHTLVTVLNYSDKDIAPKIKIKDGWSIKEMIYGNLDEIPHCDGVIMRLEKVN